MKKLAVLLVFLPVLMFGWRITGYSNSGVVTFANNGVQCTAVYHNGTLSPNYNGVSCEYDNGSLWLGNTRVRLNMALNAVQRYIEDMYSEPEPEVYCYKKRIRTRHVTRRRHRTIRYVRRHHSDMRIRIDIPRIHIQVY